MLYNIILLTDYLADFDVLRGKTPQNLPYLVVIFGYSTMLFVILPQKLRR